VIGGLLLISVVLPGLGRGARWLGTSTSTRLGSLRSGHKPLWALSQRHRL
jgi:hypothetical protein